MCYVFAKAYICLCNVYASMQYLKINTYKGLNVFLCSALSMQTMLTKQSNIKLYMQQSKALIHAKALLCVCAFICFD